MKWYWAIQFIQWNPGKSMYTSRGLSWPVEESRYVSSSLRRVEQMGGGRLVSCSLRRIC